jgi:hypothetical protein
VERSATSGFTLDDCGVCHFLFEIQFELNIVLFGGVH